MWLCEKTPFCANAISHVKLIDDVAWERLFGGAFLVVTGH